MKSVLRHAANITFASAILIVFGACADSITVINRKEKIIERNAPLGPTFKKDKFLYGQASGDADILWVVDNSEDAEVFFDKGQNQKESRFEEGYKAVTRGLVQRPGAMQFVDVRNQVILTPNNITPNEFVQGAGTLAGHFKSLFEVAKTPGGVQGLLISDRENKSRSGALRSPSNPNPFASAIQGKADPAFKGRDGRLYIIFALSSRYTESMAKTVKEYAAELMPDKDIAGVHVFNLVPKRSGTRNPYAYRPEGFLNEQLSVGWEISSVEGDICEQAPAVWAKSILDWIVAVQSEMRLTFIPEDPSQLQVLAPGRTLKFGEDFDYIPKQNSIRFSPTLTPKLIPGEPLEVRYFKHAPDPLGGN